MDGLLLSLINEAFMACFILNPDQNSKIKFIGHRIDQGITAYQSYKGFDQKRAIFRIFRTYQLGRRVIFWILDALIE